MKRYFLALLFLGLPIASGAQVVGVKANMLYWATGSPNLGLEFGLGRRMTAHLGAGFNPLKLEETRTSTPSMEHISGNAELRYWVCQRFDGLFIGAEGIYGDFTVEDIPFINAPRDYRYDGWGYAAGLVFGNHWALGRRWGMELSAGVGVAFLKYEKIGMKGGQNLDRRFKQSYLGPTKLNLSFMYFFK